MGVYVFKSKHLNVIKIGHYSKQNAWSRIAHRGFNSCICPHDIRGRVNVDDVELLFWFPSLAPRDEKKLHKSLAEYSVCGEWFSDTALSRITEFVTQTNCMADCSKDLALSTRRRL